ncbi:hypothetical protein ASF53_21650 [Methylobacterium sp. Leaf123]|uniref:hypothetical protein n=1 Tax=Methylobacterium sp. Leaf123 TaxID=1736264 RepID=UPI0006F5D436|nr:hypothetical protein [Methylobacterium sp. Leaf123]KQQ25293.1 hypothetical protein ASF53_21650 [Methylobacterium sp. Leaf123]
MIMQASHLAAAVADAYAAQAKPPLTQELIAQVRDVLVKAFEAEDGGSSGADRLERLNAALDAFETELDAVVGPRVASLDEASGAVAMRTRSEAGQPLRAFGGQ